jgi:hypothetical protein
MLMDSCWLVSRLQYRVEDIVTIQQRKRYSPATITQMQKKEMISIDGVGQTMRAAAGSNVPSQSLP